jgi:hypothetical protein
LTKIKKQKVATPLAKFIALEYEAHFRLELWYSLTKSGSYLVLSLLLPVVLFLILVVLSLNLFRIYVHSSFLVGFRHDCSDDSQAVRGRNFERMRRYVYKDRKFNNVQAEQDRLGTAEALAQSERDNEAMAMGSGAINSDFEMEGGDSSEER